MLKQTQENIRMLEFYKTMNLKFCIKVKDTEIISNFDDYINTMELLSINFKSIIGKLNTFISKNNEIENIDKYKTDISDLAIIICKEISDKLTDGILELIEIVHIVMSALNNISIVINRKTIELGDKAYDIKMVIAHFVLSLLIIVLSALTGAKIINSNQLYEILNEICMQLETYRLMNQILDNTIFFNKKKTSCCILS